MIELRHGRVVLALHVLRSDGDGHPLLHLHGLGMRTPADLPADLATWPGPVYGLDFTGHGASTVPKGGGYTPEVMMGDVDAAIDHLGTTTIVGRGLGAYVGLLAAGARAESVHGAVLCDGPGLVGGGPVPGSPQMARVDPDAPVPPDPYALIELGRDVRPADYAAEFASLAVAKSPVTDPIAVCAKSRPEWLRAVAEEVGAVGMTVPDALARFAG